MNVHRRLARVKKITIKNILHQLDGALDTDYYWRYAMQKNGFHIADYTFRKDQIAFVHMPKTGGTSFRKMLGEIEMDLFVNTNIHRPVSSQCAVGDYRYVTILREPVDRVWSYYQMVLRNPKGYPYRKFAVRGLEHFLKKCWAANDMSCQYYSGLVYQKVNEKIYQEALVNLKLFYAVLYFQNFKEEITTFLNRHNIFIQTVPHERKVRYQPPTDTEVQLIKDYNKYDLKLYQFMLENKQIICQE